jgi:hypothetical protein
LNQKRVSAFRLAEAVVQVRANTVGFAPWKALSELANTMGLGQKRKAAPKQRRKAA